MRIKIFRDNLVMNHERHINEWLKEKEDMVEIDKISQIELSGDIVTTIFYM